MDGQGNFSSGVDANHAGIESPAEVSGDERRMHVRAYNYWVSLLSGRAYPSIEDLDPENLSDFGPNSILLDFTGGIENPGIAWLGDRLRMACDLPVGLASVADIPSRSILSRLTDHYLQIIANRAPIGFEAEYVNDRGDEILYRGILMPFSSDDDTIDFIYGVINWKEAADGPTSQLLVDQVQQILDSATPAEPLPETVKPSLWPDAPARREVSPAPAWADGPRAECDLPPSFSPADHCPSDDFLELSIDDVIGPEPEEFPCSAAPSNDDALADWLAAARSSAHAAVQADHRSRATLYEALGLAYDFALLAGERAEEFAELVADSGLEVQARAPMTPVVKLVFGIGYDKTRLAEYASALNHGRRANVARGGFRAFVESYAGALKGIVSAERALRRKPTEAGLELGSKIEKARNMVPRGVIELAGDDEFIMLVGRRIDGQHVAVIGSLPQDDKLVQRALRQITN